ncbi:trypsin-like peptidase domain-containing protein [Phormidium tenue FACHB-886]|nr:trypsin-like peptidase domain-containing protein [Phormidium tenue FACHB-886]
MAQSNPYSNPKSPLQKSVIYLSLVLLGAGGVLAGNRYLANAQPVAQSAPATADPAPTTSSPAPTSSGGRVLAATNPNFIADAVQKVGPAVVRINSTRTVASRGPDFFSEDPAFGRFFGGQGEGRSPERVEEGTGSGFIVDSKGIILTNAHVIDGADEVSVTLTDGRSFSGKVMGEDPATDVAVVKIEATDLPTATLGDSTQLKPGEWAIAIGNPLGLDNTVTAGIVSATGRSSSDIGVPDRRVGFIQTDAAINPGNSGGPLLNERGEVVGMNTAIIDGAQGLGFAVPIDTAKRIADQLISTGKVEHPYLGVQMKKLTPELKTALNEDPNSPIRVQEDSGILILKVLPNSPAAQAGLQAGDVIQKISNQDVADADEVQRVVEASKIGQDLPLQLRRNGETLTLNVKPGILPNQPVE